ncbi:MAG: threonine--tRNA ligase [Chitinispirillia bacterium]|nr:threonine--tRNA ligase [Chitinispirillia bacterium]
MNVILPDGKNLPLADNACAFDVAKAISPKLAKAAVACKINGELRDLSSKLNDNDTVAILTFDNDEGKSIFWHSSSHILAQAVQELFPEAKIAIGPSIENGFYYDFDTDKPFTPEDIAAIEKKFKEITDKKLQFIRKEVCVDEARKIFGDKNEPYKIELLNDVVGQPSMYSQGDWVDLCRGPHVPDTGYIKAFKLTSVAGAYWRGKVDNPMLQRIYGISFPKQAQLDEYLTLLEEAQKRDHRKLGKDLELFTFHQEGAGFPFWHPRGMVLYNAVLDFSRKEHVKAGYQEIKTPIILNEELWRKSGHWDKYKENMYFTQIDDVTCAVKPMNCPGGLLVFKSVPRSYRQFPLKFCEFGLVHRHEKSSALHGLFRVRQFTQDDAHIFCLPDQIEDEITKVISFITYIYKVFGFDDYKIELSTRPEKYIGSLEIWEKAEGALKKVLDDGKIAYQLNPGDGAFYGPKIDFHVKDVLKRSWQCGTIQLDFSMPELLELEYTAADGEKKRPVMIHRALLGSMERFIGILLEHYGGALPLWLSPEQCRVLPISEHFTDYARKVHSELLNAGIRAEIDERNEKVGYKIREAETSKIPFMLVVGEKERDSNTVSVRQHSKGDLGSRSINEVIKAFIELSIPGTNVMDFNKSVE